MLRAVPPLLAAMLIVLPSVGSAQQKTPVEPTPAPTDAPPTAEVRPMPPPRPTPAPVPPALRHGISGTIPTVAARPPAPKATPTPPAGSIGLSYSGTGAGGVLRDADGDSETWLASEGYGIRSYGQNAGGEFGRLIGSSRAYLAIGQYGIQALGREMGGLFVDTNASGNAAVASGDIGVYASGNEAGGFFADGDSSAYAFVGYADSGIWASGGALGGYFMASGLSGRASVADGDLGVSARGNTAGGFFEDSDSSGYGYVGDGDYGMRGFGNTAGGYFKDADSSGYGYVGFGNDGVRGFGTNAGGYFEDSDSSGYASVGYGDFGVSAYGNAAGAYLRDRDGSAYAYVGNGDYGIRAYSQVIGGFFEDSDGSGAAYLAYDRASGTDAGGVTNAGEYGAYASGDLAGGYFEDSNNGSHAYIGNGSFGVRAIGLGSGGWFKNSGETTLTHVGYNRTGGTDAGGNSNVGAYGVYASGATAGGYFEDSNYTSYAYIGRGTEGVFGVGTLRGGYFGDKNDSGYAYVGYSDYGIYAGGHSAGGYFTDYNGGAYASVGSGSYKILGTGSVDFVQNHPHDQDSVIVYAAPEGDEVATYTRGTARLVAGEVRVPLGDTFKWVTNPDLGLTAHVTPRESCNGLYVDEVSTTEIVVRELQDGSSDCAFDFLVYGLRIGFEEVSVVQEKEMEAYIPAMTDHRELYTRRPELRSYNSLERFKGMHQTVAKNAGLDLSRAHALRDAIGEIDPAIHELPMPRGVEPPGRAGVHAPGTVDGAAKGDGRTAVRTQPAPHGAVSGGVVAPAASIPVDDDGNVYATSFRPSSEDLASLVELSEPVEPGDVLVIDRERPGLMRRATEASDSGVVGVVAAKPGLVLGTTTRAADGPSVPGDVRTRTGAEADVQATQALQAPAAFAGVVRCKVDAGYGAIWPGDLLVSSPTPGHAMRQDAPLPGTMLGKALEGLEEGTGTIRVLVMLR
jgi:hypothetical protein